MKEDLENLLIEIEQQQARGAPSQPSPGSALRDAFLIPTMLKGIGVLAAAAVGGIIYCNSAIKDDVPPADPTATSISGTPATTSPTSTPTIQIPQSLWGYRQVRLNFDPAFSAQLYTRVQQYPSLSQGLPTLTEFNAIQYAQLNDRTNTLSIGFPDRNKTPLAASITEEEMQSLIGLMRPNPHAEFLDSGSLQYLKERGFLPHLALLLNGSQMYSTVLVDPATRLTIYSLPSDSDIESLLKTAHEVSMSPPPSTCYCNTIVTADRAFEINYSDPVQGRQAVYTLVREAEAGWLR